MAQDATYSSSFQSEVMAKIDYLSPLPEELVDSICAWLPTLGMRNFRLASRTLKEKSSHAFAVRHFKTTQIMLTRESLETLINKIATDNRYGPNVKTLQICLVTFPLQAKSEITGLPLTEKEMVFSAENDTGTKDTLSSANILQQKLHSTIKRARRRLYDRHYHSQNALRTQSLDVTLLAEAMRLLPTLESITILGSLDAKNPPWGARKIQHDIGRWPPSAFPVPTRTNPNSSYNYLMYNKEVVRYFQRFCKHTMTVVLGSLLRSGIKLKGALKIEGAPYSFRIPEKSDSRRISPTSTPARTLSSERIQDLLPAFSELKELSLKIFHYQSFSPSDFALTEFTPLSWIEKFVPLWSSISILSISGAEHAHEPSIFGNLSAPPFKVVTGHLGSATFPHLRVLKISDTLLRIEDIIQMLQNHCSTLQEFVTHSCRPVSRLDYVNLLQALVNMPAIVKIELIRGSPKGRRVRYTWSLDGIEGVTRIEIRKRTPAAFQDALKVKIMDVLTRNMSSGSMTNTNEYE